VPLFTKQYKSVLAQAGYYSDTPRDTLALCLRTSSFGLYLAEGYGNEDQRCLMCPYGSGRTFALALDFRLQCKLDAIL